MLVLALLTLTTAQQAAPKAITLSRLFTANEKLSYEVKSHITLENRARGLESFLPEDYDMKYAFTAAVKEMKVDGIAVVHYLRPTMTEIDGETYDSTPTAKTKKVNYDYLLTVSPINEILDKVDMTRLSVPDKSGSKGGDRVAHQISTTPAGVGGSGLTVRGFSAPSSTSLRRFAPTSGYFFEPLRGANHLVTSALSDYFARSGRVSRAQDDVTDQVGQFVGELYRLALFNGPIESSLDFAPKFPFNDVAPGDTWKRTVGYQPQALKGKKGQEPVVQRLDYTYTYRGLVNVEGKTFQRVTADLSLNTDLAPWANQYIPKGSKDDGPQLAKMPMNLKATIEFDLDPKTFDTVAARAYSQGGFQVYMSDAPAQVYFESKLKGSTTLSLRSITR